MKVSKNVSIDLELLNKVVTKEKSFSRAVTEALELWLAKEKIRIPKKRIQIIDLREKTVKAELHILEDMPALYDLPNVRKILKASGLKIKPV